MTPLIPPTLRLLTLSLLLALFFIWWRMTQIQRLQPEWPSWQQLQQWLQRRGVDTSAWGHGRAKSTQHLWRELQRGETRLLANPTRRVVELVVLVVRRGDRILLETGQQLADGRFRERAWPPSEKVQQGETYLQTAVRGLHEEMGLTEQEYTLHPESHHLRYHWRDSVSYPTLPAQYCFHILEVEIPRLPDDAFTTAEANHSTDEAVKIHHWNWVEPPAAVVALLHD